MKEVLEDGLNLAVEDARVDVLLLSLNNLGRRESDVGNWVLEGLDQEGHDVLSDVFLGNERHNHLQRIQRAHAVVVPLLVDVVVLNHLWQEAVHNPVLSELLCEVSRLCDPHFSHCRCGVVQVRQEDSLEMLLEDFFSKALSQLANKPEDDHANSPLSVFGELSKLCNERSGEYFLTNDSSNLVKTFNN